MSESRMPRRVYLLHFSRPLGRVQHYLGQTARPDVMARVGEHRAGRGPSITRGAVRVGAELVLARVWEDADSGLERRLKRRGAHRRLCPVCMELSAAAGSRKPRCKSRVYTEAQPAPR